MQNLKKKTNLWFKKWLQKFEVFSPEHLKVSKLGLWWDLFIQSREWITLKFTEELCVMTMNNNTKFVEELVCHFNIDMWGILTIWGSLTQALENLKKLLFNWLLWPKYTLELKKYRGVILDGTEDWCKTWRKTDLCFQEWHEGFGKFT